MDAVSRGKGKAKIFSLKSLSCVFGSWHGSRGHFGQLELLSEGEIRQRGENVKASKKRNEKKRRENEGKMSDILRKEQGER